MSKGPSYFAGRGIVDNIDYYYFSKKKKSNIEDQYIEKDYFISLFLSSWQKLKDEGKVPHLDTLFFKGGTLLARNFLNYPRISEDIDFTYGKSNNLREIKSENKREKEIKKIVVPIIDEIKLIGDIAKFDFETDRTNPRYIDVRNSRAVYILNIYHNSSITGEEVPIKIEFMCHRLRPPFLPKSMSISMRVK